MTLYLVRHGRAAAGTEELDPPLDDTGRAQAEAAGIALASSCATRLIVSPLRRTRETADPIAATLSLLPEVRDEVAEVFDPSMPVDERRTMIGPFMAGNWSEQSDTLLAWRQRVVDALLEFGAAGSPVVIVSHYIAIGVAIGEATADDRVVPHPIANCSITTLDVEVGKLVLREPASIAHLPPELVTGTHTAIMGNR